MAVGRSKSVKGPYLDKEGRDMFGGGASVVFDSHGAITGPGRQSVFKDYLAFHYYDGSNAEIPCFPTLGLQKIEWVNGRPEFNQTVELPKVQNHGGASWQRISAQPITKRTDEGTYTSTWKLGAVTSDQDGLLVRAVFHNAYGKPLRTPSRSPSSSPSKASSVRRDHIQHGIGKRPLTDVPALSSRLAA